MSGDPDAVVVGSGPNGLAAAVTLSAAGLRVLVIEGAPTIGGGCRTEELTRPGFWHDVCSAVHPLAPASPFFRRFDLAARGVKFAHSEVVFAQPMDGGRAAVLTRSVAATAERLGPDGAAYRRLFGPLARDYAAVADLVLTPIRRPPSRLDAGIAMYAANALRSANGVARRWHTPEGRALVPGVAAHSMIPFTKPPTGAVGITLIALAHGTGWPVIEGGSARITDAMSQAVLAAGGTIETGRWVRSLADLPPARAVLLDMAPRALPSMLGDRLPARYASARHRFRYGGELAALTALRDVFGVRTPPELGPSRPLPAVQAGRGS
jgi:phytoene dehydrogenase-like protein